MNLFASTQLNVLLSFLLMLIQIHDPILSELTFNLENLEVSLGEVLVRGLAKSEAVTAHVLIPIVPVDVLFKLFVLFVEIYLSRVNLLAAL